MRVLVCLVAVATLAGCEDPRVVREPVAGSTPPAASAVEAAPAEERPSSVPTGEGPHTAAPCNRSLDLGIATADVPLGLCVRRVGEGDDMSTEVVDGDSRAHARVTMLAHGARVGDACGRDADLIGDRMVRGARVRACTKIDGRRCYAILGKANLCAAGPGDAALVDSLVTAVSP